MLAVFIAARILANPVSNVFQKQLTQRAVHPLVVIWMTHLLLTLLCLPAFFWIQLPRTSEFWLNMGVSAALAVSGNAMLVQALKGGELSVLGPLNAYKPLIGLIGAALLLGEIPSALGLVGIVLIVAGSYFIVERGVDRQGVLLRIAALVLSATEAVVLKKALLVSSPMTVFVFWAILGVPLAGVAVSARRLPLGRSWTYLWLAISTGVMQLSTVFTLGKLPVGYSLALFQLSALVSVFLGYRYFEERQLRKRLIGSGIMVAGAVLIIFQKA